MNMAVVFKLLSNRQTPGLGFVVATDLPTVDQELGCDESFPPLMMNTQRS